MKKNNALRVAAGLVVAVLLSTCLVSGTYAKYVTKAGASDEARVAKFGVNITPDAYAQLFNTGDGVKVKSSTTDNVVAPGTTGEAKAVTITGTPEVAVKVTNSATVQLTGWTLAGDAYYCPLTVTVGGRALNGNDYDSAELFEDAIKNAVSNTSATYNAGQTIDATGCPSVSWAWAFEGAQGGKQTDEKDTELGQAGTAKINISIETTVEQTN